MDRAGNAGADGRGRAAERGSRQAAGRQRAARGLSGDRNRAPAPTPHGDAAPGAAEPPQLSRRPAAAVLEGPVQVPGAAILRDLLQCDATRPEIDLTLADQPVLAPRDLLQIGRAHV